MPPKAVAIHEPRMHEVVARASEEERLSLLDQRERELETLASELEAKREELSVASRSQAEFLASLSHELRTPLNSVLILSKLLLDNVEHNLSEKQLAFARTIHSSGSDLLALINDVVELSRIQAGVLSLEPEEIALEELCAHAAHSFRQIAADRALAFTLELAPGLPKHLFTDTRRLTQVLKNLLNNAFKFTERGRITLHVAPVTEPGGGAAAEPAVAFSVIDTGIGIPEDQRSTIFETFQRAGGKPARGQRGAGLGLSLVRELSKLLGGEARLAQSSASGSRFVVRIPVRLPAVDGTLPPPSGLSLAVQAPTAGVEPAAAPRLETLIVASADAEIVRQLEPEAARAGLHLVVRARADEGVGAEPPRGVLLDLRAPGLEGWILLDHMVRGARTRQVPVFALAAEQDRARAARFGAFVIDAVTPAEMAWVVEQVSWHDPSRRRRLAALATSSRLGALALGADVETRRVQSLAELAQVLSVERFHAVLVDVGGELALGDIVESLPACARRVPLVLYTERPRSESEMKRLAAGAGRRMVALVKDEDQLALELAIALHRTRDALGADLSERLERAAGARFSLDGLKVLIIDDDVRSIFAMTSALERQGVRVSYAETGRQGLDLLAQTPDIGAVLIDIRMSEQSGYDVVRTIRDDPRRASLPLIAVTANAMPADREKCLSSGATHYLAKPTTPALLVSTLRVVTARRA